RAEEAFQGRDEVAGGQAVQVQQRQHFGDLRHQGGRITDRNRLRSPVCSSTRLPLTRGARTCTAPAALRTTSCRPCSSRSWARSARSASTSGSNAAASIRRAPSRTTSSNSETSSRLAPSSTTTVSTGAYLPDRRAHVGHARDLH